MSNPVLKQTLQMQEEQKRLEEENRLKEEESKKQNSKKVVFGSQLGVLELFEEIRIPNLDEFSRNPNKDEYPAVINGSLNPLTGRVEEFREKLLSGEFVISPSQQQLVSEFIEISNVGVNIKLPDIPRTADNISKMKINSIKDLLTNTRLIQQSLNFIEESLDFAYTDELYNEFKELNRLFKLYDLSYQSISKNLKLYTNHKGEKYGY